MRYQLINPINPKYSTIETILTNRHIPLAEVAHYLNTTDEDINKPEAFGQNCLIQAAQCLIQHIAAGSHALVIVDCDCDGFTSASILWLYIRHIFPQANLNFIVPSPSFALTFENQEIVVISPSSVLIQQDLSLSSSFMVCLICLYVEPCVS